MPQRENQRNELGLFLRSRRERIRPDEVGLPLTARRRTPGLRREELAMLAGISVTWYTYLEQGRDIRASDQVLDALARTLRLDRPERDHLFLLAGHSDVAPPDEIEPLTAEVAAVPQLLQPQPAYIIDSTYDVLSCNRAAEELFPGLISAAPRPANFACWTFLNPAAREVIVDWEQEAHGLLARLRTLVGRHPGDARYLQLIADLNEGSAEMRDWWPHYDVQIQHSGRKRLHPPGREVGEFVYTAFHLAERPELTLVLYSEQAATAS